MQPVTPKANYLRIATEEAWAPSQLIERYLGLLEDSSFHDPGFRALWKYLGTSPAQKAKDVIRRLSVLDEGRIQDMDAAGIDVQILSLTSPGVQVFDAPLAASLAEESNNILSEAITKHPTRLAGLAAAAPQDAHRAAKELERAVNTLGLKGLVINSHTRGEYLDDPKFWELLEAAESLDVPIYLHPNTPPASMIQPFLKRHMESAVYGFACETGLHALRMIFAGVFDRFPGLRIVLGHLGEGLPYWLSRIDYFHGSIVRSNRSPDVQPLRRLPSEYLKANFYYTTSGMAWEPAVMFVHQLMGPDRLLYAMDYPYQYELDEVPRLSSLPLENPDLEKLFCTNAQRLFKL